LNVTGGHQLYVEECGNPSGIPLVFLHGGPGGGCKPYHRCFFNPAKYRAVLFDQRACGRSLPLGELAHNTTADLLEDMEAIRQHLGIDRWLLFAGSWGVTLALLYAQRQPQCVSGMVLRGTFLARQRDMDWYLRDGVNRIYPESWALLLDALPEDSDPGNLIDVFQQTLHGADELAQRRAARAWAMWGGQVALGDAFTASVAESHVPAHVLQQARLEVHYGINRYFIDENQILRDCHLIPPMPLILLHGRRDLMCPLESAFSLRQALPFAELRVLPNAGHIASDPDMSLALLQAADEMAERLR
jgi:proline iminopeptidase